MPVLIVYPQTEVWFCSVAVLQSCGYALHILIKLRRKFGSELLCQLLHTSRKYSPYLSKWAFPILTRFSPDSSAISLHLRACDREVVGRSTKWNWGWKASSA